MKYYYTPEDIAKRLGYIERKLLCLKCSGTGGGGGNSSIVDIGDDDDGDPSQPNTIQVNEDGNIFVVDSEGNVFPVSGGGMGEIWVDETTITGNGTSGNPLSVIYQPIDATPTNGSTNAVQSDGVFDALALKANTSALSGYVPTTRTLTINGTALDLSANRSWTIAGTAPGGSTTQMQYNNAGAFGGASTATYDSVNSQFLSSGKTFLGDSIDVGQNFMDTTVAFSLQSSKAWLFNFYGTATAPRMFLSQAGLLRIHGLGGGGTRNVTVDNNGDLIAGTETGVVAVRTVTANTTLLTTDNILRVDASGGPVQVTFPASVSVGKSFRVKKIDTTSNPVTFTGGTVDDDPAFGLLNPKSSVILYASGATAYDIF